MYPSMMRTIAQMKAGQKKRAAAMINVIITSIIDTIRRGIGFNTGIVTLSQAEIRCLSFEWNHANYRTAITFEQ